METSLYLRNYQILPVPRQSRGFSRDNKLTTLSPEVGQLTKLTWLFLHDNQLTALPPEIGNLMKLTYMNLQNNPITDADLEYLKTLTNLIGLDLHGTKVTEEGVANLKRALKCRIGSDFDR